MVDKNEFIIVKVLDGNKNIIEHINESKKKQEERYYILNDKDNNTALVFDVHVNINVIFIIFKNDNGDYCPIQIFAGVGYFVDKIYNSNPQKRLYYTISNETTSSLIISNFVSSCGIDLKNDFKNSEYLTTETSVKIYNKLLDSVRKYSPKYSTEISKNYGSRDDDPAGIFSQKNNNCIRYFNLNNSNTADKRSEFQRDRERILHSKSFRRLVDKAQIFTSSKGDHFRTRMTHTLEVNQISRGMSKQLKLNEDLTEAIALAHDIGHTPFGHQGERTLQKLLDEKLPNVELKYRRFKHNLQGLRVLSYLDEKYIGFEGLNLSYQVLEGVLKHTKSCKDKCDKECDHSCVTIDEFLVNGDKKYLFLDVKHPTTLEGQIVKIADEIAQRGHDLDDAFASRLLSYEDFIEICSIKKLAELKKLTEKAFVEADEAFKNGYYFIDKHDAIRSELVSSIIGYLISDVVGTSLRNIEAYDHENDELYNNDKRISELLIDFSENTSFIVDFLESEISKKVINSYEVANFDNIAERVIETLFETYIKNPKLLPNNTLRRLFRDMRRHEYDVIDFRDSDIKILNKELDEIKNMPDNSSCIGEHTKYAILVRCIIDYISGMTDNFALNEYREIIGIK